MSTLIPHEAARAAQAIYKILDPVLLYKQFPQSLNDNFNLVGGTKMNGIAGGHILQSTTGFALAARGKSMACNDEALLVIRGTKQGCDFFTDVRAIPVQPNGTNVHAGFNGVFRSLEAQLAAFFSHGYHPNCVHIVGHSLGGAIGTLAADWIKTHSKATEVKLYTFGCPRVGMARFADTFTNGIGANNIFRVYGPTDLVPMVPTWPYIHVPLTGMGSYASNHLTWSPVSITAHFMDNYVNSVAGESWESLYKPQVRWDCDLDMRYWLAKQEWIGLTGFGLRMINSALAFILKTIMSATGSVFVADGHGAENLIDRLAMYLNKGAQTSKEVSGYVASLMRNILSALGIIANAPKDLTAAFIRWVFQRLSASLNFMAMMAIRGSYY
jgi:hypothetical protein